METGDITQEVIRNLVQVHKTLVLPNLRAAIPVSLHDPDFTNPTLGAHEIETKSPFDLAYIHLLVYALSNNMAGLAGFSNLAQVWQYLKNKSTVELHGFWRALSPRHVQVVSWKLLQGAIESLDAVGVDSLIKDERLDVRINSVVCMYTNPRVKRQIPCTPVELSVMVNSFSSMEVLIDAGADVNKTYNTNANGLGGALGRMVTDWPNCPPENVERLLLSGAIVDDRVIRILMPSMPHRNKTRYIFEMLMSASAAHHRFWLEKGFFHDFLKIQPAKSFDDYSLTADTVMDECAKSLVQIMVSTSDDVDAYLSTNQLRMVDILAARQLFSSLQYAQELGYNISLETVKSAALGLPDDSDDGSGDESVDDSADNTDDDSGSLPDDNEYKHPEDKFENIFNDTPKFEMDNILNMASAYHSNDSGEKDCSRDQGDPNPNLSTDFEKSSGSKVAKNSQQSTGAELMLLPDGELPSAQLKSLSLSGPQVRSDTTPNVRIHTSRDLCSLLETAIMTDNTELALILIDHGARRDIRHLCPAIPRGTLISKNKTRNVDGSDHPLALALYRKNCAVAAKILDLLAYDESNVAKLLEIAHSTQNEQAIDHLVFNKIFSNSTIQGISNLSLGPVLSSAIKSQNMPLLELLVASGANLNIPRIRSHNGIEHSPLRQAIESGFVDIVRFLLEAGVPALSTDTARMDWDAIQPEILGLLLNDGYKMHHRLAHIFCMREAIRVGNFLAVEKIVKDNNDLLTSYIDVVGTHAEFYSCISLFGEAILSQAKAKLAVLRLLLPHVKSRTDVDYVAAVSQTTDGASREFVRRIENYTPALMAAKHGDADVLALLVEYGANLNLPPTRGIKRTPLQQASESGHLRAVEYLLQHGALVNSPVATLGGATALQLAAMGGHCGIMELLLKHGADINAPPAEYQGRTALEAAAEHGRLDAVHMLLDSGTIITGEGRKYFKNAIAYARKNHHVVVAEILEEFGSRHSS